MRVQRLESDQWYERHAGVHSQMFDYGLEQAHIFRYILAVYGDNHSLCSYISVDELDGESVYLLYGGMLVEWQGKGMATDIFGLYLGYLKEHYKRVGFLTKTINKKMINLGHKMGFEIVGMRMEHGVPCVEMLLEFGG